MMQINQLILKSETKVKPLPAPTDDLTVGEHAFAAQYATHGNATKAFKAVFGIEPGRSPAAIRLAASDLALKPAVRARVVELRSIAADALSANVAELALQAHEIATASLVDIMPIDVFGCRHCHGIGGRHQWRDAAEACKAIDDWMRSANSPTPKPMPAGTEGGYGYSSRAPANPECEACRGLGVPVQRIVPSCDWSEGAKQAYEGVQTDDEGRVTKVLIADRSKWAHQRNQLAGSYAPTRVEGKHAHLHVHRQLPDTRQPMSVDEALAALGIDESTIVSTQP